MAQQGGEPQISDALPAVTIEVTSVITQLMP
jgi:hypothetical protein